MKFGVTISELESAASKLTAAVEDYGAATQATKAAADTVAAGWEGDAQKTFVEEQENAIKWYNQVAQAVNVYISAVKAAAAVYKQLDIDGVNLIR
jgi:WXG100 family type VII secretion target